MGKVVVVTGAAGGIGAAIVRGLLERDFRVVAVDLPSRTATAGQATDNAASLLWVDGDVTSEADCRSIVERAYTRFGNVDALVNNAGRGMDAISKTFMSKPLRFYESKPSDWRAIVDTNVNGTFHMTRAVAERMVSARRGSVINVGTSLATMVRKGFSPYGPSKAAIEAATVIWANELAPSGICVNVLLPGGPTDTPMVTREDAPDRSILIQPSVMLPPLLWLCSDDAVGFSGQRVIANDWNVALPPRRAAEAASAAAGWSR